MRGHAQSDRDERFDDFVRRHSAHWQRTAWLLSGDWNSSQDLVQVALAKTWSRWPRVARMDEPAAYVRRVLVTTFLAWRRRRWVGELAMGWLPDLVGDRDVYDEIDVRAMVLTAIGTLPARQRAVIVLRYFEDLSERETAAVLGCSVGTVKSQASKALVTLRGAPGLDSMKRQESV